jgi:molybdenum cofactor cytidylyltransferase
MKESESKQWVSAVVLAAGMSSRMGTPKQLLRIGEKTLLQHALENVRGSSAREIVLVLGFAAEQIQREISLHGIRVVISDNYREGLGNSLGQGLAAVDSRADAALIVLADQPFVRPRTLDRLIEQYYELNPHIVIPVYRGFRGNPVLLARSVFPEVVSLKGDVGCRAIFGSHLESILKVPVEDMGILLDMDDPSDLDKLRQAHERSDIESSLLQVVDLGNREIDRVTGDAVGQPELIVVGQDALCLTLARLARLLRFTVTVVDPLLTIRELVEADRILRILDLSRLPDTAERYVVVASRGRFDEEAVEQALAVKATYIALVSKRARAQEILRSLSLKGIAPEGLARLRFPAGIDIHADSPEEIALSIMAEIVSVRRQLHAVPGQRAGAS